MRARFESPSFASSWRGPRDGGPPRRRQWRRKRSWRCSSPNWLRRGPRLSRRRQEAARCAAELNLATVWEEMQQARGLTSALDSAVSENKQLAEREQAAAGAVAEAEGAVKEAAAALETARELDQQARTAGDKRAMKIRLLDARILHAEAAIRDDREAVERARTALAQIAPGGEGARGLRGG